MKPFLFISIISILLWSCSSGNQNTNESISDSTGIAAPDTSATETTAATDTAIQPAVITELASLKFGMTEKEVIALLGEPTKKETVGKDPNILAEDWWYGENQKVRMINRTVNHVVKDVARQKELLQMLMLAKKKNDEAEVKRIMDELTAGHK